MVDHFDIFNFEPDDLVDLIESVAKQTLESVGPVYTHLVSVHGRYRNRVEDYIDNQFKPYLNKSNAFRDEDNITYKLIQESYHDCEQDGWVHEWYIVTRRK